MRNRTNRTHRSSITNRTNGKCITNRRNRTHRTGITNRTNRTIITNIRNRRIDHIEQIEQV